MKKAKKLQIMFIIMVLTANMILCSFSLASTTSGIELKVYTWDEGFYENNIAKPRIYLENTGTKTLHNFDLYYYFTAEDGKTPVDKQFYMPNPKPDVSIVSFGGSQYALKMRFTGVNFKPGDVFPNRDGYTVGYHYSDWLAMDKSNDFSNTGINSYTLNKKVAVFGIAPDITPDTLYYGSTPSHTPDKEDYTISFNIRNDWGTGATIDVTITNNSSLPVKGWKVDWTFPGNQQIYELWQGVYSQDGNKVSVTNVPSNSTIPANGGSVTFGFNINYNTVNEKPTDAVLNGPFSGDLNEPAPDPSANIKKFIVSDIGETVKFNSYVGEPVIHKIYYKNPATTPENLVITDNISPNCQVVEIYNGGVQSGNNIIWQVPNVAPGAEGYVEVKVIYNNPSYATENAKLEVQGTTYASNSIVMRTVQKPEEGWISLIEGSKHGDEPVSYMKEDSTTGFMCNFDIPGISISEVKNGETSYQKLSIPGYVGSTDVGDPTLPVIGNVFEVPEGVNFTVEIYKSNCVTLKDYRVMPALDSERNGSVTTFEINPESYVSNEIKPENIAEAKDDNVATIRGHRLLFTDLNPVQYNPATGEIKVYSNIEFKVKYDRPAQVSEISRRLLSRSFEQMLSKAVVNYDRENMNDIDRLNPPEPSPTHGEIGCDYLILTHNSFYNDSDQIDHDSTLNRFARWKEQKGLKTMIVDVETLNPDGDVKAKDIRDYVSDAYHTWDRVPSYLLLVGDSEFIPTNYMTIHPSNNHKRTMTATDLYYAAVDGNDYYPDIFHGRISVDTREQCDVVFNKIINYEKNPPNNPQVYQDCSLIAAFDDEQSHPNNGKDGWHAIQNSEDIRTHANNNGYNCHRVYNVNYRPGHAIPPNGPEFYANGTAIPNELTQAGGFAWDGGAADISTQINNGNWFVMYDAHGYRQGWHNPSFDIIDINNLGTPGIHPVVFSLACNTGWFDNETDDAILETDPDDESFCEEFLRNPNGCVGIIGSTRISYGSNDYAIQGVYKALRPDYNPNPAVAGNQINNINMGPLQEMAQINSYMGIFTGACTGGTATKVFMEEYTVFGDPNMPVWTREPGNFNVDFPAKVGSMGEQDFVVKVTNAADGTDVNSATVTLIMDGNLIAVTQTDAGGNARFTFAPDEGEMTLTVTKLNFRPFEGVIDVTIGGANITSLSPESGTPGQSVIVTFEGIPYLGYDSQQGPADIYFGNTKVAAGVFSPATITIPSGIDLGLYNISVIGTEDDKGAVAVFTVRGPNAIDLYSYSQWDSSTYHLSSGTNPTWNSPDIQLFDSSNKPVNSGNLSVGKSYKIRSTVRNSTEFNANNAKVTFKWADFGVGQPDRVWNVIGESTISVNANSTAHAEIMWTPPRTGHVCILAEIYHPEDINPNNNKGQENCSVGVSRSPAELKFDVWNPTGSENQVYFVLRQVSNNNGSGTIWPAELRHPEPQTIAPDQFKNAYIVVDPTLIGVTMGSEEFSLTGYIDGEMIGGVNFIVEKE